MKLFNYIIKTFIIIIVFTGNIQVLADEVKTTKNITGFLIDNNRKIVIKDFVRGASKARAALIHFPSSGSSIWEHSYLVNNDNISHIIDQYVSIRYANKLREIYEEGLTKDKLVKKLTDNGFQKREPEGRVDNLLGRARDRLYQDSGDIYVASDGSMVRIKDFSETRIQRPQPHYIMAVLKNPEGPVSWQNEAFKITRYSIPVPKAPKEEYGLKLAAPNSSGYDENRGWIELIMEEVHIDLVS